MRWIDTTVGDFFDRQADKLPHQKALISFPYGDSLTFGELKNFSDLLARGMIDLGVRKGDNVAVWANNIPEWVFLFLSLSKIGAVMVPLNPNIRARDLLYDLKQADVKFLFFTESCNGTDYVKILHQAIPDLQVYSGGEVKSNKLPCLKKVVILGNKTSSQFITFSEVVDRAHKVTEVDFRSIRGKVFPSDPFIIKFTCGLTGHSRGAVLTHFGLINNAQPIARKLNFDSSDILCLPLPFHYIFGFWMGLMVTFSTLASTVIIPRYNASDVLKSIEKHRCTALYGVPTIFADLFSHQEFSRFDLSSLRTGMISGDYCPPDLIKETIEKMPIPALTTAYGITEIGLLTQTGCNESIEKSITTLGQPLDGMELKVIDSESGELLPAGMQGEICVRTPVMMKGYYNMEKETSELVDKEGWFHTGDLGTKDEEGYYRITGRKRNMIIRGGENIYPLEIEKFLQSHPDIINSRVVGVPSRRLTEEVYAFVKTSNDSTCNPQSIREFCRTQIPRHQIPRWIKIVDELPGEKEGKVDRNRLRLLAIEDLKLEGEQSLKIIYEE